NVEPDAGWQLTQGASGIASTALAINVATAPFGPVASSCSGAGSVSDGGVASLTTTWKLPEAMLFFQSFAEHDTDVVPIANNAPDCRAHVTGAGPETASAADAPKVTMAPALLV